MFPEMPFDFMFNVVQIIPIYFTCLFTTANWFDSFDLVILSILCRAMAYFSSIHVNLDSLWLRLDLQAANLF
jgi:hypothetical protein